MSGFSSYVLFRRGTLGLYALRGLVPERTWALLGEVDLLRAHRAELRESIEERLHELVPTLDKENRRAVLKVRRSIHNDRLPDLPGMAEALSGPTGDLLNQWCRALEREHEVMADADAALGVELNEGRKTLADVALDEDFQRGIQLSGEETYHEVRRYAADPFATNRKPSRMRRTESTVTSFAYRVALKPSPFGSFTEIGAQPWDAQPGRPGNRVGRTQLSIGLLMWMAHQLRHIEGADEIQRVRLNNSLLLRDGRATFVRRPLEGADDAFQQDRVISAKYTGLVSLLMKLLGDGELSERALRDGLVAASLTEDKAQETIDQLAKVGLCHRGVGFPDQTDDLARVIAERLREIATDQARSCAEIFERLHGIEQEYSQALAERRTDLIAELRNLVMRFVQVCGCAEPAPEAMRAAMYEDVGTRATANTWNPDLLVANAEHLDLFQRLVPVLDDASIEKLGLYRFHAERFDSCEVPLIELYQAFSELSPDQASIIMSGVDDPYADAVRAARGECFEFLRDRADASDGLTLDLDPTELREFVTNLSDILVPWRSAAYRVQFERGGDRQLAVINGVTTGHGVFFSRFCDLLEPADSSEWNLTAEVRQQIAHTSPRQTDITAALGLNFNLHPRLSPYELVYPGSVPRTGAESLLTLADLTVRANPQNRRLELIGSDGEVVDLVPLNFLYPAAAPMLYRFLCAFAPTRTYRGGLWEQLDRAGVTLPAQRPRVLLGDLVLDRQSWRFDIDELPPLSGLERDELAAITDFERWRLDVGMPRTSFFRIFPAANGGASRNYLEETRQWAEAARSARMHKPHFMDVRNPFLLRILAKQVNSMQGGRVVFHECLPGTSSYVGGDEASSAEEFFVEYTLDRRSRVG